MAFNPRISGPKKSQELNRPFAAELGFLMDSRKLKGKALAKLVNASEVMVSKWRKAKASPREKKFKELVEALCDTAEERARIERAYYYPHDLNHWQEEPKSKAQQIAHMKAKIEMAARAKPAKHKRQVREVINKIAIPYKQDYLVGDIVVDFMLTLHNEEFDRELEFEVLVERQFALLCEPDPDAEYDSSMAQFIKTSLCVEHVSLVVPRVGESPHQDKPLENNDVLNTQDLEAYLAELKAASVPAPVTISREEQTFPEQVKSELTKKKIRLDKKNGADCVVKRNQERIALHYDPELRDGLQEAAEAALRLKDKLKTSEVVVIIANSHGIGSLTMQNGVKIIALSQLTGSELGTN